MSRYNGWKNYETWNVALWIGNDQSLYNVAKSAINYSDFVDIVGSFESKTPDNVGYLDYRLDVSALDRMIGEL